MSLSYPAAAHTCENRRKEPEKDSLSSTRQRLDVGQASDSGVSLETAKCIQLQGTLARFRSALEVRRFPRGADQDGQQPVF
jgi:hypothetical protein